MKIMQWALLFMTATTRTTRTTRTTKIISTTSLLLLIISPNTFCQNVKNAVENHERWYQVELIIFARHNEASAQQEYWPKNISLVYPENLINLSPAGSNNPNDFSMLQPEARQLNSQANSIAKSGSYSLLFHQAWKQMITRKNTSILIQGGKIFNGHHELEGSISLSVSLYLQLQTNLWLTQFSPAATDVNDGWPELPTVPNLSAALTNPIINEVSNETPNQITAEYVTKRIVKINQQKNMRSVDIHYIDHPLLGIIIKTIPIAQ
jgi:Peptidoglycan-binding protein, CsiV